MAKRSAKVEAAVDKYVTAEKLKATSKEARVIAEKADKRISKMSAVSFAATYFTPAKKRAGLAKKSTRKKAAPAKAARPAVRRKRGLAGRALARQLVQQRDSRVKALSASKDADAAYELGASIDQHLDEIDAALKG